MKLMCQTILVNRQCPHLKSSSSKSTLALGFHPPGKENAALFLIHFTTKNKAGTRYKVKDNLLKVHTAFVKDGKATIAFKVPEHNILITCDPVQLKCFLNALKLGLENKREMAKIGIGTLSVTAAPSRSTPSDKLVIQCRADYPSKGLPRNLKYLSIIGLGRERLQPSVLELSNLRSLNLSENKIAKLPSEIGKMHLVELNMSSNLLGTCDDPDRWDWLSLRQLKNSLQMLNLSRNQLNSFPYRLVKLTNLNTLDLDNNSIKRLPFSVRRMHSLRNLSLSENQLESLPEAISHMILDKLNIWGNDFQSRSETNGHVKTAGSRTMPHLWEFALRTVIGYNLPYSPATLPWDVVDILLEAPKCICGRVTYSGEFRERSIVMPFNYVKSLIFSRDRVIYGDVMLCENDKCSRRLLNY